MCQNSVVIYEAAVRFENFFIRADILIKDKDHLELIEVKEKSFEPGEQAFLTKQGTISSSWKPYLSEVAFQKHVVQCALPDYSVSAYLMLADKKAVCPNDGLNQKFRIVKNAEGSKNVFISGDLLVEDLAQPILTKVNVDACCELIYCENIGDESFTEYLNKLVHSTLFLRTRAEAGTVKRNELAIF